MKKLTRGKMGISSMAQGEPKQGRPDREGKRLTGFFIPDAAKIQLKEMAIHDRTTIQAILSEALNDYFRKHGKPPIA